MMMCGETLDLCHVDEDTEWINRDAEEVSLIADTDVYSVEWSPHASERTPGLGYYTIGIREYHTAAELAEALSYLPADSTFSQQEKTGGMLWIEWLSNTPPEADT